MSTKKSQAERVIEKCGGPATLATWLDYDRTSIYKWTYPKSKGGAGGIIPSSILPTLIEVAGWHGVELTPEDLYPGER